MVDIAHPPLRRLLLATPHAWNVPHPVNEHVAELADGLMALRDAGVDVPLPVVVAPLPVASARRTARIALRDLARGAAPDDVFAAPELLAPAVGDRRAEGGAHDWPLIALAQPAGPASVSLRAALRVLSTRGGFDLVHLHDPLHNSLVRFITRIWDGLGVATYHHSPAVGTSASPLPLRERVVDGIDRWLVGSEAARESLDELLGDRTIPAHLVSTAAVATRAGSGGTGPVLVVGRGTDDEAALREFVREIEPLLAERPEVAVTLVDRWGGARRVPVPRAVRGRVLAVDAPTREQSDAVLSGAGVFIATAGTHPRSIEEARAAHVPVVDLAAGCDAIAAALTNAPASADAPSAEDLARAHLIEYAAVRERVHVHIAPPTASVKNCVIDLHMHTSHSWDCATDPAALLHVAREVGLTAVAITDHNEISGALAAAELADEYGIQVIVGEEVMTAQGEVIGLFLRERIEPGMSWHETLAAIHAQDGLVYVPHPFDRLHTIPDVTLLRDTLDEIDAFETYNARLPFDQYNRDAERFARKYNLVEGAGSDAHVTQGLGTAAVHMPAWDDRESFLTALGQGEILKRPKSLLYLQGLKWVNDLTGRSKPIPDAAVGKRYRGDS